MSHTDLSCKPAHTQRSRHCRPQGACRDESLPLGRGKGSGWDEGQVAQTLPGGWHLPSQGVGQGGACMAR